MTLENRERAYKKFRYSEKNYEAPENLNHSCTSTTNVRARAKVLADRLLIKNPELSKFDAKPKAEEKEEPKEEPKKDPPKAVTKSGAKAHGK